jgi:hypothetical protein
MIYDPCKKAKCILYPICLNKQKIECEDLLNSISKYITKDIKSLNNKKYKLTITQANHIHNHIIKIFPRLSLLPYQVFNELVGIIYLKRKIYTFIEKTGLTYKSVSYDYGMGEVFEAHRNTRFTISDPLGMFMK